MPDWVSLAEEPVVCRVFRVWGVDAWLWIGTILSAVVAAWAHFAGMGAVMQFWRRWWG